MLVSTDNLIIDELSNNCLVYIIGSKPTSTDEYKQLLDIWREKKKRGENLNKYRILVITDGGAHTHEQRAMWKDEFGDVVKEQLCAVISDTVTVRLVVASLALFARNLKHFDIKDLKRAVEFLGTTTNVELVKVRLKELYASTSRGQFKTLEALAGR